MVAQCPSTPQLRAKFRAPHRVPRSLPHRSDAPRFVAACPSVRQITLVLVTRAHRQRQRSAKRKTFVVRMRHDTHQALGRIVHRRISLPGIGSYSFTASSSSSDRLRVALRACSSASACTQRRRRRTNFATGANDRRCSTHGPCCCRAARCSGVAYPLCDASPY